MKKKTIVLIGLALAALCLAVLLIAGDTYVYRVPLWKAASAEDYTVRIDQKQEIIRLTDKRIEDGQICLTVEAVSRGKAHLYIEGPDEYAHLQDFYVHPGRIVTVESFFGSATGSRVIPAAVMVFLAVLLYAVIVRYREGMRESIYQYRNIRNLGWIIYIASWVLHHLMQLFSRSSVIDQIESALSAMSVLSMFALPVAFIMSILVAISSVRLMRREGRNWRNTLALLLGILVCVGTIFPNALEEYLQWHYVGGFDVHNQNGKALYIEMAARDTILAVVTYLECILLSTIILSVKAARRIPAFDKDYMLILGCQIRQDGSLTPLLQGRTDRALEFARMQEEAGGKALTFVPSGGQGADEVMPEGQAVRNYLVGTGVAAERILTEDRSKNTEENFRYSMELIREHAKETEPKIAFSTTNYHVFRSGILAREQGIDAEGIGSGTRSYFWINAFVREFIATVYSERRKHLRVIVFMILLVLLMVWMVYLANNL